MGKKSLLPTLFLLLTITQLMVVADLPFINAERLNEVNGIISSNITLTKADGPYSFKTVVVKDGAILTIEAGSSIIISGGLQVDGTLIVKGTSNEPIYFTNNLSSVTIQFSSSSKNSIIEHAIISAVPVICSSSVTIRGNYLIGAQAQSALYVNSGSPTITNNTMKGSLDGYAVVRVLGGSPIITDNNLLGYGRLVNSNSSESFFNHYSSQLIMYAVYVTGAVGGEITNNNCYGNTNGIKVESGAITVSGNTMRPQEYLALPSAQPLPAIPQTTAPTLPPYPPPSQSISPDATAAITGSTINMGATQTDAFALLTIASGVIIAAVIIIALLVAFIAVLLRKNQKSLD